jgi:VWFA-related protein
MRTFMATACVLLAVQQIPPKPTFKSGVAAVEVDVVVTDGSGRPVRGLTKDDFTITEDARPVEVAMFSAIDLPEAPSGATMPSADRSGSAHASNDQSQDGRIILIVLDDGLVTLSAARMATVKSIARHAVERLGPSDLAAVITTSGKRSGQAEFTTEKWRLLEAIDRYVPQSENDPPEIGAAPGSSVSSVQPRAERLEAVRIRASMAGLTSATKGLSKAAGQSRGNHQGSTNWLGMGLDS